MLQPIYENAVLVPTATPAVSGWENVEQFDSLRIVKTHTTGTYALTIEWSDDGVTADVVETVTVINNDAVDQPVASRFARFTITATVANFTVHKTSIYGRTGRAIIIPITELAGNVAVGTPMVSGWKLVEDYDKIRLLRTAGGGTYGAEADWSDDGASVDQTETLAIPNNDQYEEDPKGRYMRLRVTATGSTVTAHKTEASGVLRQ
jgi:hypothetical protein